MSRRGRRRPVLLTRWQLARLFSVHPGTIAAWLHEGLLGALERRGGPSRPALYDGATAIAWFNSTKAQPTPSFLAPKTLENLDAVVGQGEPSGVARERLGQIRKPKRGEGEAPGARGSVPGRAAEGQAAVCPGPGPAGAQRRKVQP